MKNLKSILYPLIFLVLALGLVSTAHAAASFTMNDLEFGSDTQVRGQDVTTVLHIINDGTDALTINLASNLNSMYKVNFSQSVVSLNPNTTADVTVKAFVPLSQASGRHQVSGGITATATGVSKTANTFMTAINMLEITKVTLEYEGTTKTLSDGSTYDKDLKAGMPITFRIYIRNNFDSSADIDIRDINVDIRGSDDLDLDESDSINDLSYREKDDISFSTTIPSDAEDGDRYDIDVTVTGTDDNDADYTTKYSARIEVNRESHEITITNVKFSPQTVSCGGKATMTVDLENTGKNTEDNVHLLIQSDSLNLEQKFYESTMKSDSTKRESYTFTVSNTTAPGQYDFLITSYYAVDRESDTNIATLTVGPCQAVVTPPTVVNPGNNVPVIPQVVPTNGATPVYGNASFTDSTLYIVLLVGAVVVVLAILIILLVKFVF